MVHNLLLVVQTGRGVFCQLFACQKSAENPATSAGFPAMSASGHQSMFDPVGFAGEVQESAVVDDPVDDRGGHVIVTEYGTPLGKRQVRRQNQTALFVGIRDDLEQQTSAIGIDG